MNQRNEEQTPIFKAVVSEKYVRYKGNLLLVEYCTELARLYAIVAPNANLFISTPSLRHTASTTYPVPVLAEELRKVVDLANKRLLESC